MGQCLCHFQATTAAVISLLSDLVAQLLTYLSGPPHVCASFVECLSLTSLRDQTLIGFFLRGAPVHFWFLFLTWIFRKYDGTTTSTSSSATSSASSIRQHMYHQLNQTTHGVIKRMKSLADASPTTAETIEMELAERKNKDPKEVIDTPKGAINQIGTETTRKSAPPLWVVVCKVLIDQLVYGPFSNWLYFYAIGLLEGRSMSQIGLLIDRDFIRLMIANWKVWPILTFLNFRFVPLQLQVLAGNIVSIFWTTYVVLLTRA